MAAAAPLLPPRPTGPVSFLEVQQFAHRSVSKPDPSSVKISFPGGVDHVFNVSSMSERKLGELVCAAAAVALRISEEQAREELRGADLRISYDRSFKTRALEINRSISCCSATWTEQFVMYVYKPERDTSIFYAPTREGGVRAVHVDGDMIRKELGLRETVWWRRILCTLACIPFLGAPCCDLCGRVTYTGVGVRRYDAFANEGCIPDRTYVDNGVRYGIGGIPTKCCNEEENLDQIPVFAEGQIETIGKIVAAKTPTVPSEFGTGASK